MEFMEDIIFICVDVNKEVKDLLKTTTEDSCNGMTSGEMKAYAMGVQNALSALKATLNNAPDDFVYVHIPGQKTSEEMDYAELKKMIIE